MKRRTKNIIMIVLIILLLGVMSLTIYKSYTKASDNHNQMMNANGERPPEMPNGSEGENGKPSGEMGNPPEKPSGENNNMEEPPSKPDGEDNNAPSGGQPPEMPNRNNDENAPTMNNLNSKGLSTNYYILFGVEGFAISIILLYLILSKFNEKSFKETFEKKNKIIIIIISTIVLTSGFIYVDKLISESLNDNKKPMNIVNNQNISYSGKTEINDDKTISSGDYSSDTFDENAILVNGEIDVTLSNINVDKTGDSDGGDNTSFYGMNSGILAKSGASLTIKNATINTNATGGNGVFSYGGSATTNNTNSDNTTINISDSKITTKKDNSGGIMVTGGGILNATNLTITTAGTSSAAIRSDRGGGTLNVNGGTYESTGQGSPSIYSTANITVKNAELTSKSSEGVIIEGKNSVTLENVNLTDTNNKLNGESTTYKNIFIYQSMSGDAADGTATFKATDSKITTNKGDSIYVTNTKTSIYLKNNTFVNNDKSSNFLRVQKDSWGNNGSNGGEVTLTIDNQKIRGNIVIDSISTLDMTMESSSYYEGTINSDNTAKSIKLKLDKSSKIKLTGDSYISSLENDDDNNSNINFNGYKLYVNGKSIN